LTGDAAEAGAFFSDAGPVTDMPVPAYLLSWATAGAANISSATCNATTFMAEPFSDGLFLMRFGFVPFLQIRRRAAGLLFFFDRPFPGLIGLPGVFPVGPLARIIGWLFLAHRAPPAI
jgi:hypothetical protein